MSMSVDLEMPKFSTIPSFNVMFISGILSYRSYVRPCHGDHRSGAAKSSSCCSCCSGMRKCCCSDSNDDGVVVVGIGAVDLGQM